MTEALRKIHRLAEEYVTFRLMGPVEYDIEDVEVKVGSGGWRATTAVPDSTDRVRFLCRPSVDGIETGNHDLLLRVNTTAEDEKPVTPAGTLLVLS